MLRERLPFAGSVRVPLILAGSAVPEGKLVGEPVTLEDLLPTCLHAAGLETPKHVEGRDLFDLMGDAPGAEPWRGWVHSEQPDSPGLEGWHMLASPEEKYVFWSRTGREMLFDLGEDPKELCDVSGDASRSSNLNAWRERMVERLADRPEGYVRGGGLVPVDEHPPLLPWAVPV